MLIHAHHSFRSMRAYIRLKLHPYDLEPLLKVLKHFYIYKEDLLWVWTVWGVSIISTNRGSKCESMHNITFRSMEHISGWSYTLMTRSHCWRCSNAIYIYKEDLLWVWTVWGVSIISSNRGSKCESMHNITFTFRSMEHISGWSYTLMTRSHCWRCSNTIYI